jgi:uncharacterized protein (DUF433 family)
VVDGHLQLAFLDLIEIRVIDGFLGFGVGWKELRHAASEGAMLLRTSHPFASFRFKTDGHRIFADIDIEPKDRRLIQLRGRQHVFREVVGPLLKGVEFDGRQAIRWWPIGEKRRVVIDPQRAFGKPIGASSGVPVTVLATYAARHGVHEAASWYDVDPTEVRDAITFTRRAAA